MFFELIFHDISCMTVPDCMGPSYIYLFICIYSAQIFIHTVTTNIYMELHSSN